MIDTETTGLDPKTDDIITIAAIKVRGNRILTSERFEAFARPDASWTPKRSRCTGCAKRTSKAAN